MDTDGHTILSEDYCSFEVAKLLKEKGFNERTFHYIPCWSLAALLNILAKESPIIKVSKRNGEYQYNIDIPSRHCKIWFSSMLDAVFEMICWLLESKKI